LAMEKLSKNTLIDFVWDLAIANVGEDNANDENVMRWIEENIETTHRYRGQRTVDLVGLMARMKGTT